ncbi:MAG: DUF190 domain-containing protein [Firmicutes bacterium]|nr:DUF190 domain-containing protein [Bacillota bacterium]
MELFDKKRISVIVEKACRDKVVKLLEDSGVSGFTVYKDIYGKGKSGVRDNYGSVSEISGNLEIVSITGPEVADRILQSLAALIDKGFVMIVHVVDVKVIREDYFE